MAAFVHAQANTQDIANLDQKIYDVVDQVSTLSGFNVAILVACISGFAKNVHRHR